MAIVTVNSTRVDSGLAEGLTTWMSTAMDHLKEWAGLGALACLMVLAAGVSLWCLCRIRLQQRRDAALIAQAFIAVDEGQSPNVWLAALQA